MKFPFSRIIPLLADFLLTKPPLNPPEGDFEAFL